MSASSFEKVAWARPLKGPNLDQASGSMGNSHPPAGTYPAIAPASLAPMGTFAWRYLQPGEINQEQPQHSLKGVMIMESAIPGTTFRKLFHYDLIMYGQQEGLPAGWERASDTHGKTVYVNHHTMTTHWLPPISSGGAGAMGAYGVPNLPGQPLIGPVGQPQYFGQLGFFPQPQPSFQPAPGLLGHAPFLGNHPSYMSSQPAALPLPGFHPQPPPSDVHQHGHPAAGSWVNPRPQAQASDASIESQQTTTGRAKRIRHKGIVRLNDVDGTLAVVATNHRGEQETRLARPPASQRQATRYLKSSTPIGMPGLQSSRFGSHPNANAENSPGLSKRTASASSSMITAYKDGNLARRASTSSISATLYGDRRSEQDDDSTPRASKLNPRPSGNMHGDGSQSLFRSAPGSGYKDRLFDEIQLRAAKIKSELLKFKGKKSWYTVEEASQIVASSLKQEIEAELQDPHKQSKELRAKNLDLLRTLTCIRPIDLAREVSGAESNAKRRTEPHERSQQRSNQADAHEEARLRGRDEQRIHKQNQQTLKNLEHAQPGDLYHLRQPLYISTNQQAQEPDDDTSMAQDTFNSPLQELPRTPTRGKASGANEDSPEFKFYSQEKPRLWHTKLDDTHRQSSRPSQTMSEMSDDSSMLSASSILKLTDGAEVATNIRPFNPYSDETASSIGTLAAGNGTDMMEAKLSTDVGQVSNSYVPPPDMYYTLKARPFEEGTAPSAIPSIIVSKKYELKSKASRMALGDDQRLLLPKAALRKRPSLLFLEGTISDAIVKAQSISREEGVYTKVTSKKLDKGKQVVRLGGLQDREAVVDDVLAPGELENAKGGSPSSEDEELPEPNPDDGMQFYEVSDGLTGKPTFYSVKTGNRAFALPPGYVIVPRGGLAVEHLKAIEGTSIAPNGSKRSQPTEILKNKSRMDFLAVMQAPPALKVVSDSSHNVRDSPYGRVPLPSRAPLPSRDPLPYGGPPSLALALSSAPPLPFGVPLGSVVNPNYDPSNQFIGPHRQQYLLPMGYQQPQASGYGSYGYGAQHYPYGSQMVQPPYGPAGAQYSYQNGYLQQQWGHQQMQMGGPSGVTNTTATEGNSSSTQTGYQSSGSSDGVQGGVPIGQQQGARGPRRPYGNVPMQRSSSWTGPLPVTPPKQITKQLS